MNKPALPDSPRRKRSHSGEKSGVYPRLRRSSRRQSEANSDVLVSAVISSYLLTHLHHVLQRAEYGASKEGRESHAANFAQLRKVLCMDARSMEDASAIGTKDSELQDSKLEQKVA